MNQNDLKNFDHRADIYSLGCIILQLFYPIGTEMELVKVSKQIANGSLPEDFKKLSPEISELVLKCLSKEPKERPSLD